MALKLYARPGWGSAIVEYQFAFYGLAYQRIEVEDLFQSEKGRETVRPLNPLAQIPTLLMDDDTVLTESAAITLWLADRTGSDALVPAAGSPERADFLRWLIFLVANIYPCFTFADDPARFVEPEAARKLFRAAVDAHEQRLWQHVEVASGEPWFLGGRLSAIDAYLAVMTRWRPGIGWFQAHAPRLWAAGERFAALPGVDRAAAANQDPLLD
ncbi:glutathione S-transferase family protein [Sandaracinobacter sp. RS1-74]|uniref:glutathione S-transferase family protein n=1 Tax=Sandaracinobacteroides sayramensis TaxID=2913411 RepID=UPI001EDB7B9D|nr:glutathione S-transferase family protein [Sandaracinobacteroides sayramensis]MCG2842498.1 glutathione S-transferase family protein [Sandaracinobacteroides sayramensis]